MTPPPGPIARGARRGALVCGAFGAAAGPGALAVEVARHGAEALGNEVVVVGAAIALVAGAGVGALWGLALGALWAFARTRVR